MDIVSNLACKWAYIAFGLLSLEGSWQWDYFIHVHLVARWQVTFFYSNQAFSL